MIRVTVTHVTITLSGENATHGPSLRKNDQERVDDQHQAEVVALEEKRGVTRSLYSFVHLNVWLSEIWKLRETGRTWDAAE